MSLHLFVRLIKESRTKKSVSTGQAGMEPEGVWAGRTLELRVRTEAGGGGVFWRRSVWPSNSRGS